MLKNTLDKINFFIGIIFFYNQLKKKKTSKLRARILHIKRFYKKK